MTALPKRRPIRTPLAVALAAALTIALPRAARADAERPTNEGLLGPVRLGAFGGVGLPRPLSIEGMVKIDDVVGLGLEYGVLPKLSVSDVDVTFNAIDADLRVFPFRDGFFVGLAVGRQHIGAATTIALPYGFGSVPEAVTADSWFVNPRVGFLWTTRWGLTLGIDAGAQIPLAASFTNTIPPQLSASQTANDVAHFFGKDVLPTVNLLRLGMLL